MRIRVPLVVGLLAVSGFVAPAGAQSADCAGVTAADLVGDGDSLGFPIGDVFSTGPAVCAPDDLWDRWFEFRTAGCAQTLTLDTVGSQFDSTLAVFDSCGGTLLACNDDAGGPGVVSSRASDQRAC